MASVAEGHPKLWVVTPNAGSLLSYPCGIRKGQGLAAGWGALRRPTSLLSGLSQEEARPRGKPASSGRREITESREETETLPHHGLLIRWISRD